VYNLRTLDQKGVGGGITARIRMAHALAEMGHEVTAYVNCPRNEIIAGVRYRHFSQFDPLETDIFVASTSGDGLDLGSLEGEKITAPVKILMVHGIELPKNIDPLFFDYVYALSNFVRKIAITNWKIDPRKLFVAHRGVENKNFNSSKRLKRDPFKLVYLGHPSKGLDSAVEILGQLRRSDPRYSLHVFGGYQLWGEQERPIRKETGLFYHGLVGQKELALRLQEMGFSLNLQAREEPFGMVINESMRAGCIVLASPVGAFPEIVCDGYNGFLVPGIHSDAPTRELAAGMIMQLMKAPEYMDSIRRNAVHSPLSWETIARAWTGHWDWSLESGSSKPVSTRKYFTGCPECNGTWLPLADGLHCLNCGRYQKNFA
jgi:glycosyltransferase involved in cell wall biosynthesis